MKKFIWTEVELIKLWTTTEDVERFTEVRKFEFTLKSKLKIPVMQNNINGPRSIKYWWITDSLF